MEADSYQISRVFMGGGDIHFRLPYFQREYAWEKENWETLLNDILVLYDLYSEEGAPEHFMGSLVVLLERTHGVLSIFKVVDGQQRLATISLIFCALSDLIKATQPALERKIRNYIVNEEESGEYFYKLLPTEKHSDRATYQNIVNRVPIESNSSRIQEAYNYFRGEIGLRLEAGEIKAEQFFMVVSKCLQVVFINLNNNEKPYQIFESLNAKGKPLSQADLIRNYIAMKLPEKLQPDVFDKYWSKVDETLQEQRLVGKSRLGELTAFLRHYLSMQAGVLINEDKVYEQFRNRVELNFPGPEQFIEEIKSIVTYAKYYYSFLNPDKEEDKEIRYWLERMTKLEVSTAYPFLLALFHAKDSNTQIKEQLIQAFEILENYLIRRYLAGEPTNYLNKAFPGLWRDIDPVVFVQSLKDALLVRNYPSDAKVRSKLASRSLYDNSSTTREKTTLVLMTLNRYLCEKAHLDVQQVLDGTSSIEHIMPQALSDDWKQDLGENYNEIYDTYLDTLGNLTLVTTGWNIELSNSRFSVKKLKLERHGLEINRSYFCQPISTWNGVTIQSRAAKLTEYILEHWPAIGVLQSPYSAYPINLTCMGQTLQVSNWRGVSYQTLMAVLSTGIAIESLAIGLEYYLRQAEFPNAHRDLPNGWYLNTNLSAYYHLYFCKKLMENASLLPAVWKVDLSDGSSKYLV